MRLTYGLPAHSKFKAAWHSDPEAAREYVRQHPKVMDPSESKPGGSTSSLESWTPEVQLLTSVLNELRIYNANYVSVSSQGRKRSKPDIVKGPKTALDREIARVREDRLAPMRTAFVPTQPKRVN